jgi:hypothetical protein
MVHAGDAVMGYTVTGRTADLSAQDIIVGIIAVTAESAGAVGGD